VAKAVCGDSFRASLENYPHIFYPPWQIPESLKNDKLNQTNM